MHEYFRPSISVWIAGRSPSPAGDHLVEQLDRAVHARRVLELRQLEEDLRQLVRRREVVPREAVDVGRMRHARGQPFSVSRAMISFCTSVAPS